MRLVLGILFVAFASVAIADQYTVNIDGTAYTVGVQGGLVYGNQNVYNVTASAFGAVGDGVTDDTAAIQAAMNAAGVDSGTVLIPSGTFKVSSSLTWVDGITVTGVGPNTRSSTRNGSVVLSAIADSSAVFSIDNPGWSIKWLEIDGNATGCIGIKTADNNNSYRFYMDGVDIHDCYYGMYLDDAYLGSIVGCSIRENVYGIRADLFNAVNVSGCFIEHNDHNMILSGSSGVSFIGTTFEGHDLDNITIDGCKGVTFTACYFEGSTGDNGWHIKAGYTTQVEELALFGGRLTRMGTASADSVYSIMLDDVRGFRMVGVAVDNRWEKKIISSTASTRRVVYDSHITGAATIQDASNTINPVYNYYKDSTFRRGLSAHTITADNSTVTIEADTFRTDGAAIKVASDSSGDDYAAARFAIDAETLALFKGRRIRAGAWVYIPSNVAGYVARTNPVAIDFYGSVGGTYTGNMSYEAFHEGGWNYMYCYADVNSGETALYFRVFADTPSGSTTTGYEHVIVDNLVITDGYASEWDIAAGRVVPHETALVPRPTTATADDATPAVTGARVLSLPGNAGATTITQLDGGAAGQQVTLLGTSATNSATISDGGNFVLKAASWTAGVDSVLTLITTNGTTWREISR